MTKHRLKITLIILFEAAFCSDEKYFGTEFPSSFEHLEQNHQKEMNFEGLPSSIVANSVNIITGDYQEATTDITLPGSAGFEVTRFYSSSNCQLGTLQYGWHLNHGGKILSQNGKDHSHVYVKGTDRSGLYFKGHKNDKRLKVPRSFMRKGVTNCTHGMMGAESDLMNDQLVVTPNGRYLKTTSQGHYFGLDTSDEEHDKEKKVSSFRLHTTTLPNLLTYSYAYKDSYSFIKKMAVHNRKNEKVSGLYLAHYEKKKNEPWESTPTYLFYKSDIFDRSIAYRFKIYGKKRNERAVLSEVISSDAPAICYTYEEAREHELCQRMIKRTLPDNRYLSISYYRTGKFYQDKVHSLLEPAGEDAKPIVTYQFSYKRDGDVCKGSVVDAIKGEKLYQWSHSLQRLEAIEHFDDRKNVILRENIHWGDHLHPNYLTSRSWIDGANQLLAGRHYLYDKAGNIIRDAFYGNLLGRGAHPTGDTLYLNFAGTDVYYTHYLYDAMHRKVFQDDGRTAYKYIYSDNSSLPYAKFTIYYGHTQLRNYYVYDDSGSLILEIEDDGISEDVNDLGRVTERKLTRYVNTLCGLPVEIRESSLDLTSGSEKLIRRTINHYNERGYLAKQEFYGSDDRFSHALQFEYDWHGNLIQETDALGNLTLRSYDLNENLISEFSLGTAVKNFTYDFMNRLIREESRASDGTILSKSYTYDKKGNCLSSCDYYGNVTHFHYDTNGRLIETIYPPIETSEGEFSSPTLTYQYDGLGRVISQTDPNGYTIKKTYTSYGHPETIQYPDGTFERFTYTNRGEVEEKFARDGSYTRYDYDPQGRELQILTYDLNGKLVKHIIKTYNAFHQTSEIDGNGNLTIFTYDFAGRLASTITGERKTTYAYDSLGRQTHIIEHLEDGAWIASVKEFDVQDQLLSEYKRDSYGHLFDRTDYIYDSQKRCIVEINHNEAGEGRTRKTYDEFGRLIRIEDPFNNTTYRSYSFIGNQATFETIDPRGNKTWILFDSLGRISIQKRLSPLDEIVEETSYRYDLRGNRVLRDQNNQGTHILTHWGYSSENCLIRTIEAFGTVEQKTVDKSYDIKGRISSITKADGVILSYTYDGLGRISSIRSSDRTISYALAYDNNDNLLEAIDEIHQGSIQRTYNAYNQLCSETFPNNQTLNYSYDKAGRLIQLTLPDGSIIKSDFEGLLPQSIQRADYKHKYLAFDCNLNPTQVELADHTLMNISYDLLDRPIHITSPHFEEKLTFTQNLLSEKKLKDNTGELTSHFTYNARDELLTEDGVVDHTFNYDWVGNPISVDGCDRQFNARNAIIKDSQANYIYDINGNRLSNGTCHYRYDALDRLIEVNVNGTTYHYSYDATGRRIRREFNNHVEHFLWQQEQEIASVTSQGIQELRILDPCGEAIALELNQTLYVPINDAFGHLRTLQNSSGTPITTYRYSSFGEETCVGAPLSPWTYANQRTDKESGLIYFGKRFYDPATLCWITPDPIDDTDGPNLYGYVHNNPLLYIDPDGCFSLSRWIADNTAMAAISVSSLSMGAAGALFTGFAEGVAAGLIDGFAGTAIDLSVDYLQGSAMANSSYGSNLIGKLVGSAIGAVVLPHKEIFQLIKNANKIRTAAQTLHTASKVSKAVSAAVTAEKATKISSAAIRTQQVSRRMFAARHLGQKGEEAVFQATGFIKNTEKLDSIMGLKKRIPDIYNKNDMILGEVKNCNYLSFSSQLKDFLAISKQKDFNFYLYVRPDTKLSKPLQNVIQKEGINLKYINQ